jgi:TetR/AcrR family tetracycline transcriptional repressor
VVRHSSDPRPDRRRLDLSLAKVLDVAHTLVQREGPLALSMRRIGRELGVEPMALYRYVGDRAQLLDALVNRYVDRMFDDPLLQADSDDDWRAFLTHLGHGIRELALAQPAVFPLLATHPPAAPWLRPPLRSLRWVEQFLTGLLQRGFADDGAAEAYRAFTSFLLGHLLLEISALTPTGVEPSAPEDQRPDAATLTAQAATPTPSGPAPAQSQAQNLHDYPVLTRLADRLGQDHAQQEFQSALTSLLDRISRLSANPPEQ